MPFFFLITGLRTSFAFDDPTVWLLFGISSFLCVFGKIIGHGIAAPLGGVRLGLERLGLFIAE